MCVFICAHVYAYTYSTVALDTCNTLSGQWRSASQSKRWYMVWFLFPQHIALSFCVVDKPNPPDSVKSMCINEYQEINAQNLRLNWTHLPWIKLVDGIDIRDASDSFQELVISRHKHPNEYFYHRLSTSFNSRDQQTLRLDSDYCVTLVASARGLQPYFLSKGNSTLHRCSESIYIHIQICTCGCLYSAHDNCWL